MTKSFRKPDKQAQIIEPLLLTPVQKRLIICYVMGSCGKGLFEDVPAFFDGIPKDKRDKLYPELRVAADEFLARCRHKLLVLASLDAIP